jgi:hypothetical protein
VRPRLGVAIERCQHEISAASGIHSSARFGCVVAQAPVIAHHEQHSHIRHCIGQNTPCPGP